MRRVVEQNRGYRRSSPRGISCEEWSSVRCRDLPADGRIAQYPLQEVEQVRSRYGGLPGGSEAVRNPPQEVEQSCDGYCGLSGNDGAARNPPQEVEQDRGRYGDLPGGADLLIEARQWSEPDLCGGPGEVLLAVGVVGGV